MHSSSIRLLAPVLAVPFFAVSVRAQVVIFSGNAGVPVTAGTTAGSRTSFGSGLSGMRFSAKGLLGGLKALNFDPKAQKDLGEKLEAAAKKTVKPQRPLPPPPSP